MPTGFGATAAAQAASGGCDHVARMWPVRSAPIAATGVLAGLALFTASAIAGGLASDGVYRGKLGGARASITISFHVSANGGSVSDLKISGLPMYCPGNGPPGTPSIVFAKAPVSAAGRFTSIGKDVITSGRLKGAVAATLTVSGSFASGGSEHGTVTTEFGGAAAACSGHSAYTAKHA
jgi:hypothetical protein